MRSALVLSQVQPHFLYHSLTAIAQLCEQAPAEAKKAAFAEYLRTNMNSLSAKGTVPFTTELKHIETYLYLEQLPFGDELFVDMDIETTDFRLPALTIQPPVENAVKWGVGQAEDGGTVRISTRETPLGAEITISDNGVGFDPEHPAKDGGEYFGPRPSANDLRREADGGEPAGTGHGGAGVHPAQPGLSRGPFEGETHDKHKKEIPGDGSHLKQDHPFCDPCRRVYRDHGRAAIGRGYLLCRHFHFV